MPQHHPSVASELARNFMIGFLFVLAIAFFPWVAIHWNQAPVHIEQPPQLHKR